MSTLQHLNIAGAYNSNGGVWPKSLSSGVMFYQGQKVTKEDFRRYRRDGMEMKLSVNKIETNKSGGVLCKN